MPDKRFEAFGHTDSLHLRAAQGWLELGNHHELKRTQEAFDQLLAVAKRFSAVWTIPYNLSCYCAQLGRLGECRKWFKKAMVLNKRAVQRAAVDDPDLKPLWDSMSGTVWKRTE